MEQYKVKKKVFFDERAHKEFYSLSLDLQSKFEDVIKKLELIGNLRMPYAKRINSELFEIRINYMGIWRGFYAYLRENKIVILNIFNKKVQKSPKKP